MQKENNNLIEENKNYQNTIYNKYYINFLKNFFINLINIMIYGNMIIFNFSLNCYFSKIIYLNLN